ncbi:UrcA family protein [Caulobacter sp. S45]|uniref:UrcA family protein n=1 Tax=Caulobacter sp. S45 TaxID=1641861 RepID=UPI00131C3E3A|nr:UrcA family protein [Caulobacter sp. S45]
MTKFINILTSVGFIAMAAVPLAAIGSVAHAAEVQVVKVADLDLSSPAGAARFQRRVDAAANQLCGAGRTRAACRAAVREEAVAKLGEGQRQTLQLAMTGDHEMAAGV